MILPLFFPPTASVVREDAADAFFNLPASTTSIILPLVFTLNASVVRDAAVDTFSNLPASSTLLNLPLPNLDRGNLQLDTC